MVLTIMQSMLIERNLIMAYNDLRAFLQRLKDEGQLLHVEQQVNLEPDLGGAGWSVTRLGDNAPALLFDNFYGYEPRKTGAVNVVGPCAHHPFILVPPKNTPFNNPSFSFII